MASTRHQIIITVTVEGGIIRYAIEGYATAPYVYLALSMMLHDIMENVKKGGRELPFPVRRP